MESGVHSIIKEENDDWTKKKRKKKAAQWRHNFANTKCRILFLEFGSQGFDNKNNNEDFSVYIYMVRDVIEPIFNEC